MKVTKYKSFSGIVLHGVTPVTSWPGYNATSHIDRCVLLAAQLEAPKWGTVQSYDGCGVSGGILHHTATFPGKQTLGSLWPLLEAIEKATGKQILPGVDIRKGEPFRNGVLMTGDDIRVLFNGTKDGVTADPIPTPIYDAVAAVHTVLCSDGSRASQVAAARQWLLRMTAAFPLAGVCTATDLASARSTDFRSPDIELAYAVARSFVVNNPAAARECFTSAGSVTDPAFPVKLYQAYSRHPKWPNRTKNTVSAVQRLGLWPSDAVATLRENLIRKP
jgi:hypothetical protein